MRIISINWSIIALFAGLVAAGGQTSAGPLVGELGRLDALAFEGNKEISSEKLLEGLGWQLDFYLASHPLASLTDYTNSLQRMMQRGYQRAGFGEVKVRVTPDATSHRVAVRLEEGPRYLCGKVMVTGGKTLTNDWARQKIIQAVSEGPPENRAATNNAQTLWVANTTAPLDGPAMQGLSGRVSQALADLGYFTHKFTAKPVLDPARNRADLLITIEEEGMKSVIESIEVAGARKNTREQVLKYLELKPGLELSGRLLNEVTNRLWNSARFLKHQVATHPGSEPGKVKLVLDLAELEEAPALDKDLSRETEAFLKFRDWLVTCQARPENLVLDVSFQASNAVIRAEFILSDSGVVLLSRNGPTDSSPLSWSWVATPQVRGLYLPEEKRKCASASSSGSVIVIASLVPSAVPSKSKPFSFSLGAGFNTADDGPPLQIKMDLAPVGFAHFASMITNSVLDRGVLTCAHQGSGPEDMHYTLKIEATTGRLLQFTGGSSGTRGQLQVNIRSEQGAFEHSVNEIAAATAGHTNKYQPENPFASSYGFVLGALPDLPFLPWLAAQQSKLEELHRWQSIWRKIDFQKLLAPVDDLLPALTRAITVTNQFVIPSEAPLNLPSQLTAIFQRLAQRYPQASYLGNAAYLSELLRGYGILVLRGSDKLWAPDSWPWTLTREITFAMSGETRYLEADLARVAALDEAGPIACVAAAALSVKPTLQETLASKAMTRLTPELVQRDFRLLLGGESVGGRLLLNAFSAFAVLSDEEATELFREKGPDFRLLFLEAVRIARANTNNALLAEALQPAIEQHWETIIRPRLVSLIEPMMPLTYTPTTPAGWFQRGVKLQAIARSPGELAEVGACYLKAAEQDYPHAACRLGVLCLARQASAPRSQLKTWLEKDANGDCAFAQFELGVMKAAGDPPSEKPDPTAAAGWFQKAAERGQPAAAFLLGNAYQMGNGVPKDEAEAARWFRHAAEKDHPDAQFALARCYETGKGVPQENGEALKWFRHAAESGSVQAQVALRQRLSDGLTPRRDDIQAQRGKLSARQKHYKEAAGDFSKLAEAHPVNHLFYHLLAPALVAAGDVEGYRRCCQKVIAQFGETTYPTVAERMAKACLILPSSGADMAIVSKMAEVAIRADTNHTLLPYFQFSKGLAEYRQERFANAAEWLRKALDSKRSPDDYRDVQAYMVLAMSQYQLKQVGEARKTLAAGTDLASQKLPKADSGDLGPAWNDWIIAETLMHEAMGLIKDK